MQRTARFTRHPDADVRIESAKLAIRTLLRLRLYPSHKKDLLTVCLWKLTEAEGRGKYGTRYFSRRALSSPRTEWQHEHVFERKKLVALLLEDPARLDEVAEVAVGCVVTKEEHRRLTMADRQRPDLNGWERYQAAGIEVVDRMTQHTFGI
jgi:hypothetical protein